MNSSSQQATVEEHVDDVEIGDYYISTSSVTSTTPSSSNSIIEILDETEDELDGEIPAPLCRRDLANDIATSLWGLVTPKNFGRVMPGVYRCGFPKPENFSFLKTLGLKSILTLVPEPYSDAHRQFIIDNSIDHFQIGIEPNKDPFVTIPQCSMSAALGVVLNPANHPLLIHCNKGKHRTGCVVGCLRKIIGWELAHIFTEYHRYADPKARVLDERFIELFDERSMLWLARNHNFLPVCEPMNDSPISTSTTTTRLRG